MENKPKLQLRWNLKQETHIYGNVCMERKIPQSNEKYRKDPKKIGQLKNLL